MKRIAHYLILLLSTMILFSCAAKSAKNKYEAKLEEIHQQVKSKEYGKLYDDGHAFLKKQSTSEEFVKLMKDNHDKYGEIKDVAVYESKIAKPKKDMDSDVKFYQYKITAERGKYIELISIVEDSSKELKLGSYNVFDYSLQD